MGFFLLINYDNLKLTHLIWSNVTLNDSFIKEVLLISFFNMLLNLGLILKENNFKTHIQILYEIWYRKKGKWYSSIV